MAGVHHDRVIESLDFWGLESGNFDDLEVVVVRGYANAIVLQINPFDRAPGTAPSFGPGPLVLLELSLHIRIVPCKLIDKVPHLPNHVRLIDKVRLVSIDLPRTMEFVNRVVAEGSLDVGIGVEAHVIIKCEEAGVKEYLGREEPTHVVIPFGQT